MLISLLLQRAVNQDAVFCDVVKTMLFPLLNFPIHLL